MYVKYKFLFSVSIYSRTENQEQLLKKPGMCFICKKTGSSAPRYWTTLRLCVKDRQLKVLKRRWAVSWSVCKRSHMANKKKYFVKYFAFLIPIILLKHTTELQCNSYYNNKWNENQVANVIYVTALIYV